MLFLGRKLFIFDILKKGLPLNDMNKYIQHLWTIFILGNIKVYLVK